MLISNMFLKNIFVNLRNLRDIVFQNCYLMPYSLCARALPQCCQKLPVHLYLQKKNVFFLILLLRIRIRALKVTQNRFIVPKIIFKLCSMLRTAFIRQLSKRQIYNPLSPTFNFCSILNFIARSSNNLIAVQKSLVSSGSVSFKILDRT